MRSEKPIGMEGEKMNTNGCHVTDEDDSETSFGGGQTGLFDRLGMKIDDALHSIFTTYEFDFYLIEKFI